MKNKPVEEQFIKERVQETFDRICDFVGRDENV